MNSFSTPFAKLNILTVNNTANQGYLPRATFHYSYLAITSTNRQNNFAITTFRKSARSIVIKFDLFQYSIMALSASFTIINRDTSLPPLLLPNVNSSNNFNNPNYHDGGYESQKLMALHGNNQFLSPPMPPQLIKNVNIHSSSNSFTGLTDPISNSSSVTSLSPSPSISPSGSISLPTPSNGSASINSTLDDLASLAAKNTRSGPKSKRSSKGKLTKNNSRGRGKNNAAAHHIAKRQRVGPSCDKCRVKKIKCNATSNILVQDLDIVSLFSTKLHYEFSPEEILNENSEVNQYMRRKHIIDAPSIQNLKECIRKNQNPQNKTLVKHIDKLIIFQPCDSCQKKKNNLLITANSTPIEIRQNPKFQKTHELLISHCNCTFSKGFTRSDISIYTKITYHQKKGKSIGFMHEDAGSSIYNMTTADYFAASL